MCNLEYVFEFTENWLIKIANVISRHARDKIHRFLLHVSVKNQLAFSQITWVLKPARAYYFRLCVFLWLSNQSKTGFRVWFLACYMVVCVWFIHFILVDISFFCLFYFQSYFFLGNLDLTWVSTLYVIKYIHAQNGVSPRWCSQ